MIWQSYLYEYKSPLFSTQLWLGLGSGQDWERGQALLSISSLSHVHLGDHVALFRYFSCLEHSTKTATSILKHFPTQILSSLPLSHIHLSHRDRILESMCSKFIVKIKQPLRGQSYTQPSGLSKEKLGFLPSQPEFFPFLSTGYPLCLYQVTGEMTYQTNTGYGDNSLLMNTGSTSGTTSRPEGKFQWWPIMLR